MTASRIADSQKIESVKSRLGRSLIRIHQGSVANHVQQQHAKQLFDEWKKRWAHRRDQIAHRLELIEAQLEELSEPDHQHPQLAIVTAPHGTDELSE